MKYTIIVRWRNAAGNGDHQSVVVKAYNIHEARDSAVNEIVSKYPNVYSPFAVHTEGQ